MTLTEAAGGGGFDNFDTAVAAPEFEPVPPGVYVARVLSGEATATKAGADAYRMKFEIVEGPHTGRTLIRTYTFGPKAIGYTKTDLRKLGIDTQEKLLSPFPETGREYVVQLLVALQRGDDGITRNDIKRITVLRVTDSPAADFLLGGQGEGGQQ